SLEPDDLAGISVLYPAAGFLDSTGAIAGRVIDQDGTPLFGTHLVAENLDTGARIGILSGAEPKAATSGDYLLAGLTPGRYRLHVEPLSGEITEENLGGIFTGLAVGFSPEYYDNAATADLAQTLSVTAGDRVEGIDFTTGLLQPGHPYLLSLARLANTPDTEGPYRLQVEMAEAAEVLLRRRTAPAGVVTTTTMERLSGNTFEGRIPGQPVGTRVEYQVEARGISGDLLIFPGAEEWLSFKVVRLSGAPLAFTALRGEDAVVVLDTGTREEVARIAVADEPIQVLLAPDGGRLFVSCLAGEEVEVIDTGTFQVVDRIATGTMPLDLALSPAGDRLYVTDSGSGSLTLADLNSGERWTVQLPAMDSGPYGVAAAGGRVFVADLAANRVLVLDADGAVLSAVPVPGEPRSLAAASDGSEVYVTSMSSGTLTVIDVASGTLSRSLALPVAGTFAVSPSPDGTKVYLTAYGEGEMLVVDPRDGALGPTVAVGANPRAVSFSPDGALAYVTSADADEIAIVDAKADTL
ncbi:MAG: PQQ-binding-like beta-propeller repeat protein, partial [Candidatus Latescibacterota bacterium]